MKNFRARLCLFAGSILFATLLGEVLLRLLLPGPQPTFLRVHPVVGHWNRPGVEGYAVVETVAPVRINSWGMRDDEYPVERNAKRRFAILGDSFAEAIQVELKDTFHSLLEAKYQDRLEVLNFGTSGFGTAQCLLAYREFVRPFKPDVVILCFNPRNDFQDNDRELSAGYPRPYFTMDNDELVLDASFRQSKKHTRSAVTYGIYYFLTDHLMLAGVLDKMRYRFGLNDANVRDGAKKPVPSSSSAESEGTSDLLFHPVSAKHAAVWALTERLLVELNREIRGDRARFVLLIGDSLPQQTDWQGDRYYVEHRLGAFCEKHGIPHGEMGRRAVEEWEKNRRSVVGFHGRREGHWNQLGHQVAFEILSQTLEKNGFLPQ